MSAPVRLSTRFPTSLRVDARHACCVTLMWMCATLAADVTFAGVWTPIGPRGDMGPAVGEMGIGRIASIQIDPTTGNLYVGASSGGIWRTDPTTGLPPIWEDLGRNLPHPSVGALAVHPQLPNDILVGTGDSGREYDQAGGFSGGAGMFHTMDAGGHWTKVVLPSPFDSQPPATFFRILYQPGSNSVILAASSSGLFRSQSGPNGFWNRVLIAGAVSDLVFDPSNADTVFACVVSGPQGTGIYKSVDAGQNWNSIFSQNGATRGAIAICRHTPSNMATVWETGVNVSAVLKSPDGGGTWPSIGDSLVGANGNAGDVLAIAIAPSDPNQIYVGASNPWWTLDNGQNWVKVPPLPIARHGDITQLYFSPLDDLGLWLCGDGGVYRYQLGADHSVSFNGDATNGLQVSQIYKVDARGNLRFCAMQDDGISGSLDGGASWRPFHIGDYLVDGSDVALTLPDNSNPEFWFIYGYESGGFPVVRGQFSGSLKSVTTPPPSAKTSGLYYDRISDRVFTVTYTGPNGSQLKSYPRLANSESDATLEVGDGPKGVEGIAGSYLDGQTFCLWVKKPGVVNPPTSFNVLVYRRSGPIWNRTQALIGAPGNARGVTQVLASRQWPGEAWATLIGGQNDAKVFHSTDFGATWTDISGDLDSLAIGGVNTIAVSPFDNNELYVGTGQGGVYRSVGRRADGRRHWEPFQDGLPIVSVTDMHYVVDESHTGTDKLVIGTYGRGMYERALDRTGPVYVDQRYFFPPWFGTIELPYGTMGLGMGNTPLGGRMLLNGSMVYSGAQTLTQPMTIGAYGTPAVLGPMVGTPSRVPPSRASLRADGGKPRGRIR